METEFASAERATAQELAEDIKAVRDLPLVMELTGLLPDAFVILNRHRQIVYCNPSLVALLDLSGPEAIYGMRPGEAMNCIHATTSAGGCGTTAFCKYCGAVNAILSSQKTPGESAQNECRLTVGEENQSFDFKIRANTLSLMNRHFTLMVVQDIGAEKRRRILERLFFHDILNTAGGIQGLIELMQEATHEELNEFLSLAEASTETLVDEINAQRDLLAAEQGELTVDESQINSKSQLQKIQDTYQAHPMARDKTIRIHGNTADTDIICDPGLLTRILGNMVKNALEAEPDGATITLGADVENGQFEFWVANPTHMPEEVRMQIFQRSFSTKGLGRGLGTYSLKLFGETYLGGTVGFSSTLDEGTRFFFRLPLPG
jgi:signal transduction histidine kinase